MLDCFPVQWTDYTTMYQYKGGQTSGNQSEAEPSVSEPVHPPRNQSIYQRLHIIAESLGFEDVSRKGVPIPSYINDILKSIDDQELREVCGKRMSLSAKMRKSRSILELEYKYQRHRLQYRFKNNLCAPPKTNGGPASIITM